MIPEPSVARRMRRLIADHDIDTVWFGAAAPLALLSPLARGAGATRVIASTHGHEVGWSMLPVARTALRRIGNDADVVTFISRLHPRPVRLGVRTATPRWSTCRPGVDTDRFAARLGRPGRAAGPLRARRPAGRRVRVAAGAAQGPGHADPRAARDPRTRRRRRAGHRRRRPVPDDLRRLAHEFGVAEHVVFTDGVPAEELPAHHAMADVFAMPCRTRGAGLDVEGLGIVYLEASATGVPVVAGDSGGAPESVRDGETGLVVDGWDVGADRRRRRRPARRPRPRRRDGRGGPATGSSTNWQWRTKAQRLSASCSTG